MLDPQIAGLLQLMESSGTPPMSQGTPAQAREGFRMLTVGLRDPATLAPVRSSTDLELPGGIPARVYLPEVDGPTPTVVFFHGGGFVIGDLETHDDQARLICAEVGAAVLSVDYRLAPEHRWPAGLEDCLAATRWAAEHVDELGGDASRIAVAGDSAGGNLSAAVCLELRGSGPKIAAQLLLYPAVDFVEESEHPSREENASGYFLTSEDMQWFAETYVPEGADRRDPRLSVLHAPDLSGLPPAIVATAQYDPLRDEGEAYADALEKAGVRVVRHRFDGLIHGFFGLGPLSPAAAEANALLCKDLRDLLTEESS